jgi:hypothetical protein
MMTSKSWILYFLLGLIFFAACGIRQDTTNEPLATQDSTDTIVDKEEDNTTLDRKTTGEDGIFKEQKTFTVNNISVTRHHIFIKQGQTEEHIYYTFFEDQSKFAKLNEVIAEFANIARLDSIKIGGTSPLEDEEASYEGTQRIDSVYFINPDLITVEFNYQYMANGMECENKENKLISYSIPKKNVIGLKDIFGAKTSEAQRVIGEKLKTEFLKEIDNYAENAYTKPSEESINVYKQKFTTTNFLKDAYLGIFKDTLAFSYTLGNECNLPPFVVGKVAIKDLADLLPKDSAYLKD